MYGRRVGGRPWENMYIPEGESVGMDLDGRGNDRAAEGEALSRALLSVDALRNDFLP